MAHHCKQGSNSSKSQQVKAANKTLIELTVDEYSSLTMIMKDYGLARPAWLYKKFYTNQFRTKLLNSVLYEAGLDRQLCYENLDGNSWAINGHSVWHKINKK